MKKKISSDVLWMFLANLFFAFSQWLILSMLSKFGDSTILGQYSLALAITAPIVMFLNFQLRSIVATDQDKKFEFREYFYFRFLIQLVSIVAILGILIFSDYNFETRIIIFIVLIMKIIESYTDIIHGFFQSKSEIIIIAKSTFMKSLLTILVVFISLYYFETSLIVTLLAILCVWLMRIFLYDLNKLKLLYDLKGEIKISKLKMIMMSTYTLGILSLVTSLNTNIPRYFIEIYLNIETLGYFTAIAYIFVAANMIIKPVVLVISPYLSRLYSQKEKMKFINVNVGMIILVLTFGMVILVFSHIWGEEILTILYTSSFVEYKSILIILVYGMIINFLTTIMNISIVIARVYSKQAFFSILILGLTFLISMFLIPTMGIKGAAYSLVIIYFLQFLNSLYLFLTAIRRINHV